MKSTTILISLATLLCAAHLLGHDDDLQARSKEHLRKVASKLVIGTRQEDALKVLGTNGFADGWIELGTNRWEMHCCYTNVLPVSQVDLLLRFRSAQDTTHAVVTNYSEMMTNSVLIAVFVGDEQIAHTNSP
jgi:hypothetical protein